MGWRLQLSDSPLLRVEILRGNPELVAVWTSPQDVYFFDVMTGNSHDRLHIVSPALSDPRHPIWRAFLATLRAPNRTFLPLVQTGQMVVSTSHDGRLRTYHYPDHRLMLDVDGQLVTLNRSHGHALSAVGLDRELGTVCGLDAENWLHVYQQQIYMGAFPITRDSDRGPVVVALADAGDRVWILVGDELLSVSMNGHVLHRAAVSGAVSLVCSADGQSLVVGEYENNRITVYNSQLQPIRRRSLPELLECTVPLQLFEDGSNEPDPMLPVAVSDGAHVAFALSGTVCVVSMEDFGELPVPRLLF